MLVIYKNINDNLNIHYGTVLTSNINENTIYIDIEPLGSIKTNKKDWKNKLIDSVSVEYILAFCDSKTDFINHYPKIL